MDNVKELSESERTQVKCWGPNQRYVAVSTPPSPEVTIHYRDEHGNIVADVTPWHPETFDEYKLKLAFHRVREHLEVRK